MVELRAYAPGILDAVRPCNHQRIARAAEMRSDLFAPLEGRVRRPSPADWNVIGRLGAAQFIDVLDQKRGVFGYALKCREFVKASAECALHRGAVVANFPKDERVVQLVSFLESVDHASAFIVCLRGIG